MLDDSTCHPLAFLPSTLLFTSISRPPHLFIPTDHPAVAYSAFTPMIHPAPLAEPRTPRASSLVSGQDYEWLKEHSPERLSPAKKPSNPKRTSTDDEEEPPTHRVAVLPLRARYRPAARVAYMSGIPREPQLDPSWFDGSFSTIGWEPWSSALAEIDDG